MRTFGLLGRQLSHSFSANYFAKKFTDENIRDAEYLLFEIDIIDEINLLVARNSGLEGLNVTIPYKKAVIPFLQHLSAEASASGSVNCIRIFRSNSKPILCGYNTDIQGIEATLQPLLPNKHIQALILGTGGAAASVAWVLLHAGVRYKFVSRTIQNSETILYSQLDANTILANQLIINTTPLGMFPDIKSHPYLPFQYLTTEHILFDLIYNPEETVFLKKGFEKGCRVINGMKMFKVQAEKSWEIWNTNPAHFVSFPCGSPQL
jgi:shikimate dehydrogenase